MRATQLPADTAIVKIGNYYYPVRILDLDNNYSYYRKHNPRTGNDENVCYTRRLYAAKFLNTVRQED